MSVRWMATACYLRCDADPEHPCPALIEGPADNTQPEPVLRHTARLLGWDYLIGLDLCPAHLRTVRSRQATLADPERMAWLREQAAKLDRRRDGTSDS